MPTLEEYQNMVGVGSVAAPSELTLSETTAERSLISLQFDKAVTNFRLNRAYRERQQFGKHGKTDPEVEKKILQFSQSLHSIENELQSRAADDGFTEAVGGFVSGSVAEVAGYLGYNLGQTYDNYRQKVKDAHGFWGTGLTAVTASGGAVVDLLWDNMYDAEYGSLYQGLVQDGVAPDIAEGAAQVYAPLSAMFELVTFGKGAATKPAKKAIQGQLSRRIRYYFKESLKEGLEQVPGEVRTELLQYTAEFASRNFAVAIHNEVNEDSIPLQDLEQFTAGFVETGARSAIGMYGFNVGVSVGKTATLGPYATQIEKLKTIPRHLLDPAGKQVDAWVERNTSSLQNLAADETHRVQQFIGRLARSLPESERGSFLDEMNLHPAQDVQTEGLQELQPLRSGKGEAEKGGGSIYKTQEGKLLLAISEAANVDTLVDAASQLYVRHLSDSQIQRFAQTDALWKGLNVRTGKLEAQGGELPALDALQDFYTATPLFLESSVASKLDPDVALPAQQILARVQAAGMGKAEMELFNYAGLQDFIKANPKVTPRELAGWMRENAPQIETVKLWAETAKAGGQVGANVQHTLESVYNLSIEGAVIFFDSLLTGQQSAEEAALRMWERFGKKHTQERKESYIASWAKDLASWRDWKTGFWEERIDSATATYTTVNPKQLSDMPGAVDILVKLPQKARKLTEAEKRKTWGTGFNSEAMTKPAEPLYESSHYPQSGANLLVHVRGYMEETADERKVFHVFEAQSDWGQDVREQENAVKTAKVVGMGYDPEVKRTYYDFDMLGDTIRGFGNTEQDARQSALEFINSGNYSKDVQSHPLLSHYNSLAMKAAIRHAIEQGADSIALSDAETAMVTEGHDGYVRIPPGKYEIQWDGQSETAEIKDDGQVLLGGRELSSATVSAEVRQAVKNSGVKEEAPQAKGMRLHYDQKLPKILAELTGYSGTPVYFGEHQNKRGFTITAKEYPLQNVRQKFSLTGRNKPANPNILAAFYNSGLGEKEQGVIAALGNVDKKVLEGVQDQLALHKYATALLSEGYLQELSVALGMSVEELVKIPGDWLWVQAARYTYTDDPTLMQRIFLDDKGNMPEDLNVRDVLTKLSQEKGLMGDIARGMLTLSEEFLSSKLLQQRVYHRMKVFWDGVIVDDPSPGTTAFYDSGAQVIGIMPTDGAMTFLHEVMHSFTAVEIAENLPDSIKGLRGEELISTLEKYAVDKTVAAPVQNILKVYTTMVRQFIGGDAERMAMVGDPRALSQGVGSATAGLFYGLGSVFEFVAQAINSPTFATTLNGIQLSDLGLADVGKSTDSLITRVKTVLDSILSAVMQLMGLQDTGKDATTTPYQAVVRNSLLIPQTIQRFSNPQDYYDRHSRQLSAEPSRATRQELLQKWRNGEPLTPGEMMDIQSMSENLSQNMVKYLRKGKVDVPGMEELADWLGSNFKALYSKMTTVQFRVEDKNGAKVAVFTDFPTLERFMEQHKGRGYRYVTFRKNTALPAAGGMQVNKLLEDMLVAEDERKGFYGVIHDPVNNQLYDIYRSPNKRYRIYIRDDRGKVVDTVEVTNIMQSELEQGKVKLSGSQKKYLSNDTVWVPSDKLRTGGEAAQWQAILSDLGQMDLQQIFDFMDEHDLERPPDLKDKQTALNAVMDQMQPKIRAFFQEKPFMGVEEVYYMSEAIHRFRQGDRRGAVDTLLHRNPLSKVVHYGREGLTQLFSYWAEGMVETLARFNPEVGKRLRPQAARVHDARRRIAGAMRQSLEKVRVAMMYTTDTGGNPAKIAQRRREINDLVELRPVQDNNVAYTSKFIDAINGKKVKLTAIQQSVVDAAMSVRDDIGELMEKGSVRGEKMGQGGTFLFNAQKKVKDEEGNETRGVFVPFSADASEAYPRVYTSEMYDIFTSGNDAILQVLAEAVTPKELGVKMQSRVKETASMMKKEGRRSYEKAMPLEHSRLVDDMPAAIRIPVGQFASRVIPMMETDPFRMVQRLIDQAAARYSFIQEFFMFDPETGRYRNDHHQARVSALLRDFRKLEHNYRSEELFKALLRGWNGMSVNSQKVAQMGSKTGFIINDVVGTATSLIRTLQLPLSFIVQIPEPLGLPMSIYGLRNYVKTLPKVGASVTADVLQKLNRISGVVSKNKALAEFVEKWSPYHDDYLGHIGAIGYAYGGNRITPFNKTRDLAQLASNVVLAPLHYVSYKAEQHVAFMAQSMVAQLKKGKARGLYQIALHNLGFASPQIARFMEGEITAADERSIIQRAVGHGLGTSMFATERSVAHNDPRYRSVVFYDSYFANRARRLVQNYARMREFAKSGNPALRGQQMQLVREFAGTAVSGIAATLLYSLITGGYEDAERRIHEAANDSEAAKELFKQAFVYQMFGGPGAAVYRGLLNNNLNNVAEVVIGASAPINTGLDIISAMLEMGEYQNRTSADRLTRALRKNFRLASMWSDVWLAHFASSNEQHLHSANRAYFRYLRQHDMFQSVYSKKRKEADYIQFHSRVVKMGRLVTREGLHFDRQKFYDMWEDALEVTREMNRGDYRNKAYSTIRAFRYFDTMDERQEQDMRKFLGDETYYYLKSVDSLLEAYADTLK